MADRRSVLEHELDASPWQRVEATLMHLSRSIRQLYDARLRDLSITLTDASLLSYVGEHGPMSQIRLAEAMGMGRASTGARIAHLESRLLLTRHIDPADARVWMVSTTRSGLDLVARIADVDRAVRAELRAGINHEDRRQLARTLQRIQANTAGAMQREE